MIISILLGCAYILIKVIPKIPGLKKLTSVPFLFLVPMLLSNLNVLPINHSFYSPLQNFVLYAAIFFMVANIDIKVIARSLKPRLFILFFMGCLGTAIGGVIAFFLFTPLFGAEDSAWVVAATTAMYTGGSMNWVAVASALRMPATLSAAAFPVGIIIYTLYLTFIVSLKKGALRERLAKWLGGESNESVYIAKSSMDSERIREVQFNDFLKGFFYFSITYAGSIIISKLLAPYVFIPEVLLITTLALIMGHFLKLKYLKGTPAFGEACLYFLLTIIGVQGNLVEALSNAPLLILFPIVIILIHIVVTLFLAKLLKTDLTTTLVTSIAAIGGGIVYGTLKARNLSKLS